MTETFTCNSRDEVVVYTDGSCKNNGKPNAVAGYGVWFGPNHKFNRSNPVIGSATSNDAEIQGCIKALRIAKGQGIRKVVVKVDSEFVKQCVLVWLPKWQNKEIIPSKITEYKNYLMELHELQHCFDSMRVVHVPAHQGVKGNEKANRLAKKAVSKQHR